MKRLLLFLPFVLLLLVAQGSPNAAISSPGPGEILRGQVSITGTTSDPNFLSAQLDFSYASSPIKTWFPLQALSQPVFDSLLYTWDTTAISHGEYILRLRVFLSDGSVQEARVAVSVQNDARPTPTPAPTATPEQVIALVPTPFLLAASPTPTDSAWSNLRDGPYMATPLLYRGILYVVSSRGVLTALEPRTGKQTYQQRIAPGGYSASPIAADGRIYVTSEAGEIFAIRAGATSRSSPGADERNHHGHAGIGRKHPVCAHRARNMGACRQRQVAAALSSNVIRAALDDMPGAYAMKAVTALGAILLISILRLPAAGIRSFDLAAPLEGESETTANVSLGDLNGDGTPDIVLAKGPLGRTLATMDDALAAQKVMVAQLPTKGVATIYSRIGDLFACCV